jgi:hypothetical protein
VVQAAARLVQNVAERQRDRFHMGIQAFGLMGWQRGQKMVLAGTTRSGHK